MIYLLSIVVLRSYRGDYRNLRPCVNLMIGLAIQGVYLAVALNDDSTSLLSTYGAAIILLMLGVCLIYNLILMIVALSRIPKACRIFRKTNKEPTQSEIDQLDIP